MYDKFPRDVIEAAMGIVNEEGEVLSLQEDYRGRFMHGQTCFGIVHARPAHLLKLFMAIGDVCAQDEGYNGPREKAWRMANDATSESLGLDLITYFPGWQLTDE